MDSDDNAPVPVNFQKAKDIKFDKNSSGEFILPQSKILLRLVRGKGLFGGILGLYIVCLSI